MGELIDLLKQVLGSWQVLFITVAVIIYFSLVSYVAKLHHAARRPRRQARPKKAAAPELVEDSAEITAGPEDEEILEE